MSRFNFWLASLAAAVLLVGGCTEPNPGPAPSAQTIDSFIKPEDRLIHAIERSNIDGVREALASGSDPNSPGSGELPPLEVAAAHGFVEAGRILLARQVDINRVPMVKAKDNMGNPIERPGNAALHAAVGGGHVEFVKFLLENKADVNIRNGRGATPLDIATTTETMLKHIEELPTTAPEKLPEITARLATTNTLIQLLKDNGGRTTDDIAAEDLKSINSGGILGQLPEAIRNKPVPRDAEKPEKGKKPERESNKPSLKPARPAATAEAPATSP